MTRTKGLLACAVLGLSVALPAQAHGGHGGHGYYHHGGLGFVGDVIALPFVIGAAVIGTAATIATAPFYAADRYDNSYYAPAPAYYAPAPRVYYAPQPRVYYPQQPAYYAPQSRVYYGPPPVYVQPRVVYRSYAAPPPVYYQQAPSGY